MIAMLFVSCDKNDNNGDDTTDSASSSDVATDVATEAATMDGGDIFANDNEAVYKDSWK